MKMVGDKKPMNEMDKKCETMEMLKECKMNWDKLDDMERTRCKRAMEMMGRENEMSDEEVREKAMGCMDKEEMKKMDSEKMAECKKMMYAMKKKMDRTCDEDSDMPMCQNQCREKQGQKVEDYKREMGMTAKKCAVMEPEKESEEGKKCAMVMYKMKCLEMDEESNDEEALKCAEMFNKEMDDEKEGENMKKMEMMIMKKMKECESCSEGECKKECAMAAMKAKCMKEYDDMNEDEQQKCRNMKAKMETEMDMEDAKMKRWMSGLKEMGMQEGCDKDSESEQCKMIRFQMSCLMREGRDDARNEEKDGRHEGILRKGRKGIREV